MFDYEIEIARREQLFHFYSYPYKVVPISDRAKQSFYVYMLPTRGPLMPITGKMISEVVTEENLARYPFSGKLTFVYDDPKQTESTRIEMARMHAIWSMANSGVDGFSHPDLRIKSYVAVLTEGIDYRIEIGDKIVYKRPAELSYDVIKAL
jgi:hypothetical protein